MSKTITVPVGIAKLDNMICGCADSKKTWGVLHTALKRAASEDKYDKDGDGLAECLLDYTNLTEHGSAIRGAWITDDGKVCLEFLDKWGIDWKDGDGEGDQTVEFVDGEGVHRGLI